MGQELHPRPDHLSFYVHFPAKLMGLGATKRPGKDQGEEIVYLLNLERKA
ncbi:MAG: hypothetical protein P8186_14385 [Anaerolineae bacterium]